MIHVKRLLIGISFVVCLLAIAFGVTELMLLFGKYIVGTLIIGAALVLAYTIGKDVVK